MTTPDFTVLNGGPNREERDERLAAGADELARGGRPSALSNQRLLLTVAAGTMSFGVCVILLGWFGAAHTTLVEEQVPYLISGGLLGLALAVIGAVTLFAHWLTVLIRDGRAHEAARRQDHEELMDAMRSLTAAVTDGEDANGRTRGARPQRPIRRAPGGS